MYIEGEVNNIWAIGERAEQIWVLFAWLTNGSSVLNCFQQGACLYKQSKLLLALALIKKVTFIKLKS